MPEKTRNSKLVPPGSNPAPADKPLEDTIHSQSADDLIAAASDPRMTEDLALAMLVRRDLPSQALERLHKNSAITKLRKVRLAIVTHPRTPRHVSVPVIRHLYTFELMQVALLPAVAADIKIAAEEALIGRLATISAGERSTLAKQSSGRVAAALLLDKEERIMLSALANPHMTEALLAKALRSEKGSELLVPAVCHHEKWSLRNDIKAALLGNENTPLARVLQFAQELPVSVVKEILLNSRLSSNVKSYLQSIVAKQVL